MITSRPARPPGNRKLDSFTLLELLVVIAIAAILAVISVTAFSKLMRATNITAAAQALAGGLNNARQEAVSRNTDVEFRLYELPDPGQAYNATPVTEYRAFQSFIIANGSTNQLTKISYLPNLALVSTNTTATSFMALTAQQGSTFTQGNSTSSTGQTLPLFGTNYKAITFRFSPNGGLEATPTTLTSWTISLYLQNDKTITAATGLPADFATIQIDPFSGAATVFRP